MQWCSGSLDNVSDIARTAMSSSGMHQQTQQMYNPEVDWQPMQFKVNIVGLIWYRGYSSSTSPAAAFRTLCNWPSRHVPRTARIPLQQSSLLLTNVGINCFMSWQMTCWRMWQMSQMNQAPASDTCSAKVNSAAMNTARSRTTAGGLMMSLPTHTLRSTLVSCWKPTMSAKPDDFHLSAIIDVTSTNGWQQQCTVPLTTWPHMLMLVVSKDVNLVIACIEDDDIFTLLDEMDCHTLPTTICISLFPFQCDWNMLF